MNEQYPNGECYHNCLRWVCHHPDGDPCVVHGSVRDVYGRRILHAWVELPDGGVVDPTIGDRMGKAVYYILARAQAHERYSATNALINAVRSGHGGPWNPEERYKEAECQTG